MKLVYKIVPELAWKETEGQSEFKGFGIDLNDPFIHLSDSDQVESTLEKFFKSQAGLVLVEIDSDSLGDSIVWEKSEDDNLFPHLYGSLPISSVKNVYPISLGADGKHVLPAPFCI
ncbi:hypothetical protein AS026_22115 [Rhizobium altiplani]|uniref:Dihydroorotate dehydrogenase n=1 Tax=Rhizobium altiplani TaxID=1864509 RepID=A0A109J3Z9_9HYPH|nr:DUF952 domain-containing protein [Rhizobium altiplani]KWV41874.1 hypothetical protein AS026_22115 [Rhizobium altiplani]